MDVSPRFEAKYTTTEAVAARIRDWLSPAFSPDAHTDPATGRYTVNTLYLDTRDRRLYADAKLRALRRFKLRVRSYGLRPGPVLVLEVKLRHDRVVWKRRVPASRADWPGLLEEPAPPGTMPYLASLCGAAPVAHIRYEREAWVSDLDHYGRVTFDRALRYRLCHGDPGLEPDDDDLILYDDPASARCPDSPVLVEVKTETLVPAWTEALIRRFGLVQRGFSKYCYAVDRCEEAWAGADRVPAG